MATMNVSLPDAMRDWVEAQVNTGEYANASDYVRALIRQDLREREALKLALQAGENSGVSNRKISDIIATTKVRMNNAAE